MVYLYTWISYIALLWWHDEFSIISVKKQLCLVSFILYGMFFIWCHLLLMICSSLLLKFSFFMGSKIQACAIGVKAKLNWQRKLFKFLRHSLSYSCFLFVVNVTVMTILAVLILVHNLEYDSWYIYQQIHLPRHLHSLHTLVHH